MVIPNHFSELLLLMVDQLIFIEGDYVIKMQFLID